MKKVTKVFKFVLLILIFVYMTIYISDRNGYFSYSNYRKSEITEEGIKRFESDIKEGKAIDIEEYIEKEKDYSNNISRLSLGISNRLGNIIRKGIVSFFDGITSNFD